MTPLRPIRHSARLQAKVAMAGRGSGRGSIFVPFEPPMVPSPSQVTPSTSAPPKKRCPRASKSAPTLQPIGIPDQASSSAPEPIKRSTLNIVWEGRHTDQLVEWITTHIADWHILFHDHSTSTSASRPPPGDKLSGKSKKEVSAVIARHIFASDPDHLSLYAADPSKYVTSVINRLGA